jgi:hypothetical protein
MPFRRNLRYAFLFRLAAQAGYRLKQERRSLRMAPAFLPAAKRRLFKTWEE